VDTALSKWSLPSCQYCIWTLAPSIEFQWVVLDRKREPDVSAAQESLIASTAASPPPRPGKRHPENSAGVTKKLGPPANAVQLCIAAIELAAASIEPRHLVKMD